MTVKVEMPQAPVDAAALRLRSGRTKLFASVAFCALIALGGCATSEAPTSSAAKSTMPATTASAENKSDATPQVKEETPKLSDSDIRKAAIEATRTQDYVAAATYWSSLYDRDPKDADTAVNYSRALRQIGSLEQSGTVMQKIYLTEADNADVLAEYGKVLTSLGKTDQAVALLQHASELNKKDWTVFSAYGVALDQLGRFDEAQAQYGAALALSPNNPTVLANLGLSYAQSGDIDGAEKVLRQAVADPRGDAHARQNLALVLSIKGNFTEAARLAKADLPAQIADNNLTYMHEMLAAPAVYKQMEQLDQQNAGKTSAPATSQP